MHDAGGGGGHHSGGGHHGGDFGGLHHTHHHSHHSHHRTDDGYLADNGFSSGGRGTSGPWAPAIGVAVIVLLIIAVAFLAS